jgi:hypothetical protein
MIVFLIATVVGGFFMSDAWVKATARTTAEQTQARYQGTPVPYGKLPPGNYEVKSCLNQNVFRHGAVLVAMRYDPTGIAYYLVQETVPQMCKEHYLFTVGGNAR